MIFHILISKQLSKGRMKESFFIFQIILNTEFYYSLGNWDRQKTVRILCY